MNRTEEQHAADEDNARLITNNPDDLPAGTATLTWPLRARRGYGFYVGRAHELRGERAIIQRSGFEVIAQFDRYKTKMCYGWHKFNVLDFVITFDDDDNNPGNWESIDD